MALVLFHREFQQNASFGQYRRAADHVAAQQHFVGDPLRDRKDLLLFRFLIVNQLPTRTAEHITGLCKGFFLLFQFFGIPVIIRVQKGNVIALCELYTAVSGCGRSFVCLIPDIPYPVIFSVTPHLFHRIVRGIVVDHQDFQRGFCCLAKD